MKLKLDAYTFEARLLPVIITSLPIGLVVIALFPLKFLGWGLLAGLITSSGVGMLLAQMGRDLGKNKEKHLFDQWNGKPSTFILRHRSGILNPITLKRYHEKLSQLVPNTSAVAIEQEQENPINADQVYETWADWLRVQTRDHLKYVLIFDENKSYGFRRNLWGLKLYGIAFSVVSFFIVSILFFYELFNTGNAQPLVVIIIALNSLFLIAWLFWFTPKWVKIAGEAYARQLIEACDTM